MKDLCNNFNLLYDVVIGSDICHGIHYELYHRLFSYVRTEIWVRLLSRQNLISR